ncbi:MAG TPA: GNAT family N-acetyltransferase [Thermoflexales bacterium]|mgnify:CR=1 FL=1|nr:GNAT family N-acetyltransferase [Thermoflexales bacterium]
MPLPALRLATTADAPAITACVCEAYIHYIERIGKQPGPMLDDYRDVIGSADVHVAVEEQRILGVIVLMRTPEGFYIDNVAVRPSARGRGIGRQLLAFAASEAKRQGYASIYLATHELMTENRQLYAHIGYVEYDHRVVNGYPRVFMRKTLE